MRSLLDLKGLRQFVTFFCLSIGSIAPAMAGGMDSGGGPGIYCPKAKATDRYEVLDLYEGKVLKGYTYAGNKQDVLIQIREQTTQIGMFDRGLMYAIQSEAKNLQKTAQFLPKGVFINVPPDLGSSTAVPVPRDCQVLGIGYYESSGQLVVSQDFYSHLKPTRQAAFWIHEAVYHLARAQQKWSRAGSKPVSDSKIVRQFVGALFARQESAQALLIELGDQIFGQRTPLSYAGIYTENARKYMDYFGGPLILKTLPGHVRIRYQNVNADVNCHVYQKVDGVETVDTPIEGDGEITLTLERSVKDFRVYAIGGDGERAFNCTSAGRGKIQVFVANDLILEQFGFDVGWPVFVIDRDSL